jgi:hypothetical protein
VSVGVRRAAECSSAVRRLPDGGRKRLRGAVRRARIARSSTDQ